MSYEAHVAEHRRLSILRVLEHAPGYAANDSILQTAIGRFGLAASRDQVKGDLAWLKEQALVTLETIEQVIVATITRRGLDVAQGLAEVPGVHRLGPK